MVIDVAALRELLSELAMDVSQSLGTESIEIVFESVDHAPSLAREDDVSWIECVERFVPTRLPPLEDHVPIDPFRLTRDELRLIDAGLSDVVGAGFRAYRLARHEKRAAFFLGFLLEGAGGRYRFELRRDD